MGLRVLQVILSKETLEHSSLPAAPNQKGIYLVASLGRHFEIYHVAFATSTVPCAFYMLGCMRQSSESGNAKALRFRAKQGLQKLGGRLGRLHILRIALMRRILTANNARMLGLSVGLCK